jgi:hypothetical protein
MIDILDFEMPQYILYIYNVHEPHQVQAFLIFYLIPKK